MITAAKINRLMFMTFPFEAPPGIELPLLGDLIICPAIVLAESIEQEKPFTTFCPYGYPWMLAFPLWI